MRNYALFDKELELRNVADGAETSTAAETAVNLDVISFQKYKAKVFITAVDVTTGDEAYTFDVQVSTASGGTFVTVGSFVLAAGAAVVGEFEIPLSAQNVYEHVSAADWIRVRATLAGTTPSVTYGCYLTLL